MSVGDENSSVHIGQSRNITSADTNVPRYAKRKHGGAPLKSQRPPKNFLRRLPGGSRLSNEQ